MPTIGANACVLVGYVLDSALRETLSYLRGLSGNSPTYRLGKLAGREQRLSELPVAALYEGRCAHPECAR